MFPSFVEEIELGRYLRQLLARRENRTVTLEPHQDATGQLSTHVFDVYGMESVEPPA
jgi:hypothetical protein